MVLHRAGTIAERRKPRAEELEKTFHARLLSASGELSSLLSVEARRRLLLGHVFHPVAQHAVDQAGHLGGHGLKLGSVLRKEVSKFFALNLPKIRKASCGVQEALDSKEQIGCGGQI